MLYKIITLLSLLVFITGCSDPKIDTTNEETIKSSIQKVRDSLSADKKEEFDKSIKILMFSQIDMKNIFANAFAGKTVDKDQLANDMKKSINGKTGLEVIALAHELKEKREKEEAIKEQAELEELKTKQLMYESNKNKLAQFKIISSKFSKREKTQYSMREQPIIELTVKNETEFPISRAYFKGTIKSEGRSIPWLVENFNYTISGGIEPQEESTWSLSPNMFSKWGSVDSPKDAIFTVEVEMLDGANGKELFSIRNFSDKDKERLEELENKYK